jgi:hypothetical protein
MPLKRPIPKEGQWAIVTTRKGKCVAVYEAGKWREAFRDRAVLMVISYLPIEAPDEGEESGTF